MTICPPNTSLLPYDKICFFPLIVQEASIALEITVERKGFRTMVLSVPTSLNSHTRMLMPLYYVQNTPTL